VRSRGNTTTTNLNLITITNIIIINLITTIDITRTKGGNEDSPGEGARHPNPRECRGFSHIGKIIPRTMINGVRVRDSGVELSPTGTDRRGGPRNGIQPHGSSFFGNRGRIDVMAHAADHAQVTLGA
jgi:hypothetical protein